MRLYPFKDCIAGAEIQMRKGANIYQQFSCSGCGTKQGIDEPNIFYKKGKCQECGWVTDIEKEGCNYMVHFAMGGSNGNAGHDVPPGTA